MAQFTNLWTPPDSESETCDFVVRKSVVLPEDFAVPPVVPEGGFKFLVTVDGEPYANQECTIKDAIGQKRASTTNNEGVLCLGADEVATFEKVPVNVDYKVQEIESIDENGNPVVFGSTEASGLWHVVGKDTLVGSTKGPVTSVVPFSGVSFLSGAVVDTKAVLSPVMSLRRSWFF